MSKEQSEISDEGSHGMIGGTPAPGEQPLPEEDAAASFAAGLDERRELGGEVNPPEEPSPGEERTRAEVKSLPGREGQVALPEGEEKAARPIPMPGTEDAASGESIPVPAPETPESLDVEGLTAAPMEELPLGEEGGPTAGKLEEAAAAEGEPAQPQVTPPGTGVARGPLSPDDERRLASIAHGSVLLSLVTGLGGIATALVIWLAYRDRSRYVSFQALQAALFQSLILVGAGILTVAAVALWLIALGTLVVLVGLVFVIPAIVLTVAAALLPLAGIVYGIIGAVDTYRGQDFRYWIVGRHIPTDWYDK